MLVVEETPTIGFLPYGKPGTRCAPGFDDLGVGAGIRADPFEKIKDQGFDRIGHRFCLVSGKTRSLGPRLADIIAAGCRKQKRSGQAPVSPAAALFAKIESE